MANRPRTSGISGTPPWSQTWPKVKRWVLNAVSSPTVARNSPKASVTAAVTTRPRWATTTSTIAMSAAMANSAEPKFEAMSASGWANRINTITLTMPPTKLAL